ncbi:MAG: hypothetical protein QOE77_3111 [Blastocatellia bacterium]|jgi:SAM-dependent methyltransferase|nr:hypothetical protein [Blastocatellia bacterium]
MSWPLRVKSFIRRRASFSTPMDAVFSEIFEKRTWGDDESVSGPGSTLARTATFRDEIALLLEALGTKTLLDAGCGDFNWLKETQLGAIRYVGVDVVPKLIARNQQAFGSDTRTFLKRDMTTDSLPQADVILCRDALVHFSLAEISSAIQNFKRSKATYLLATTFVALGKNTEIVTGSWRRINLQIPPFRFPEPLQVIDEQCEHSGGIYRDKRLSLWRLADLVV